MARPINVVYNQIITDAQAEPELQGLNSNSITAIYRLLAYILAIAINLHEQFWDLFKVEIQEIANRAVPGTVAWYHQQCLQFQYGDQLIWQDGKYQYADTTSSAALIKQIIKRAAVYELGNQLMIKVVKLNNNIPEALNSVAPSYELPAFKAYINQIKFAGTSVQIISYPPDLLRITLNVKYDPQVLDSTGKLLSGTNYPVNDAIEAYIADVIYGGSINKTKLIDAVQSAAGVIDPILILLEATFNNGTYSTITTQDYQAVSGYFIINTITVNYIT